MARPSASPFYAGMLLQRTSTIGILLFSVPPGSRLRERLDTSDYMPAGPSRELRKSEYHT
jgi:hypothetical protein